LEANDVNTTIDEYLTLSPTHRDRVRVAVRDLAVRANERYAGLLAAEAVLAARTTYPDTHRLVFRLADDITGTTATLVAAYNRTGALLWHADHDGEWPDESEVTDLLAASVDWYDGHPFTESREDKDLDEYELPTTHIAPPPQPTTSDR